MGACLGHSSGVQHGAGSGTAFWQRDVSILFIPQALKQPAQVMQHLCGLPGPGFMHSLQTMALSPLTNRNGQLPAFSYLVHKVENGELGLKCNPS